MSNKDEATWVDQIVPHWSQTRHLRQKKGRPLWLHLEQPMMYIQVDFAEEQWRRDITKALHNDIRINGEASMQETINARGKQSDR